MNIRVEITDEMKKEALNCLENVKGKPTHLGLNDELHNIVGEKVFEEILKKLGKNFETLKGYYNTHLYKIDDEIFDLKIGKYIKNRMFDDLVFCYADKKYNANKNENIDKVVMIWIEGYDREKRFDINQCGCGYIVGGIPYDEIGKLELTPDKYQRTKSYKKAWQELEPVLV